MPIDILPSAPDKILMPVNAGRSTIEQVDPSTGLSGRDDSGSSGSSLGERILEGVEEIIGPFPGRQEGEDTSVNSTPQIDPVDGYGTAVSNAEQGGFSLSQFMADNPGMTYQQILQEAAKHSDEYAEVYLNYLTERGELDAANQYTANREDTAYQRLVSDLQAAGLNPAMMFGSHATPSAAGSQGYVKMSEGANSRQIGNYSKLKTLLYKMLNYELQKSKLITDSVFNGLDFITDLLRVFVP